MADFATVMRRTGRPCDSSGSAPMEGHLKAASTGSSTELPDCCSPFALLSSQSDERIDGRGAPRGDDGRCERDEHEDESRTGEIAEVRW
jgi:hypothetical protein